MNTLMWMHPLTAQHIHFVSTALGYEVVGPIEKQLACGDVGQGAMVEYTDIIDLVVRRYGLVLQRKSERYFPPPVSARATWTGKRFSPVAPRAPAEEEKQGRQTTGEEEEGKGAKSGGKDTRSSVLQMYGPPPDDPMTTTPEAEVEHEPESPLDEQPPPLPSRPVGIEPLEQ